MIKIIKEGKLNYSYTHTCQRCNCEFTYSDEDILKDSNLTYEQSFLYCPYCGTKIILNSQTFIQTYPIYPNPPITYCDTSCDCKCENKE